MKDGVFLMYMKDGVVYPVALSDREFDLLQLLVKPFEPLTIAKDQPQGKAINLLDKENTNVTD